MKLDLDQFSGESQSSESLHFENMDDEVDDGRKAGRGETSMPLNVSLAEEQENISQKGAEMKSHTQQPLSQTMNQTVQ